MSDAKAGKTSCLCGRVGLEAKNISPHVHACHCSMCRKWGGGPLLAVDCGLEVTLLGEEHISVYDSSEWAERGFCSHCGSHLFYRLKANGQYIVPVGSIDTSKSDFAFEQEIFIDEKPSWYHFGNDTKTMTSAEVFTKYAPSDT